MLYSGVQVLLYLTVPGTYSYLVNTEYEVCRMYHIVHSTRYQVLTGSKYQRYCFIYEYTVFNFSTVHFVGTSNYITFQEKELLQACLNGQKSLIQTLDHTTTTMLRMVRPGWVKDQVAFFSGMSTRSQQQDAFYKLLIELQKSRGYTIH